MPQARLPAQAEAQRRQLLDADVEAWHVSDGVLFSVLSSLLLWSLIVTAVHASLT